MDEYADSVARLRERRNWDSDWRDLTVELGGDAAEQRDWLFEIDEDGPIPKEYRPRQTRGS